MLIKHANHAESVTMRNYIREHASNIHCSTITHSGRILENRINILLEVTNCKNITMDIILQAR
jgi:hypothetical protein